MTASSSTKQLVRVLKKAGRSSFVALGAGQATYKLSDRSSTAQVVTIIGSEPGQSVNLEGSFARVIVD